MPTASAPAPQRLHPRISVNGVCFPGASLAENIAAWHALGAHTVGEHVRKLEAAGWEAAITLLKASGLRVESFVHPCEARLDDAAGWAVFQAGFCRSIDAAAAVGARSVYTTSGHRGSLTWEDAADGFRELMQPVLAHAREAGVHLLVEPTVPLHADKSIVHTLRDAATLAERSGVGICLDLFHCWTEAGLQESIVRAMPHVHLVQVGDYCFGDRALPCRAVVGDGDIPIERILGWILDAGYTGVFDLEQNGPRIEREGPLEATRRGAGRLAEILTNLNCY